MKLESRKEDQPNEPLSTAALAHADERREPQNRAQVRTNDPLTASLTDREPEPVVRDVDRMDGGPALVPPRPARTGESGHMEHRPAIADRQPGPVGNMQEEDRNTPLFAEQESKDLSARWDALQVAFIDEPRHAVEQADHLVATAMKRTAEIFAEERARLEQQWDRGDSVSTEDLRIALRRYRSFFRRLLSV
jgi:hypothetical protein